MSKVKIVADTGANLNSVITPFLDMAFQILGFFVMTYHPSALEGHIDGRLLPPDQGISSGSGGGAKDVDLPPLVEDPMVEDHYKVIIRAVKEGQTEAGRQDGEPSQIFLNSPQDPAGQGAPLADIDITFEDGLKKLKEELTRILTSGGEKSKIRIMADGNLKYQYVMLCYDVCKTTQVDHEKDKKKFADVSFVGPSR